MDAFSEENDSTLSELMSCFLGGSHRVVPQRDNPGLNNSILSGLTVEARQKGGRAREITGVWSRAVRRLRPRNRGGMNRGGDGFLDMQSGFPMPRSPGVRGGNGRSRQVPTACRRFQWNDDGVIRASIWNGCLFRRE